MILIEVICDRQDARARGRKPCASRDNDNPTGQGRTPEGAMLTARAAASGKGWVRRFNRAKGRLEWVCRNCDDLAQEDIREGVS